MKRRINPYIFSFLMIIFGFTLLFIVSMGNQTMSITTYNVNNTKSIQAVRLADQYYSIFSSKQTSIPVIYENFTDAVIAAQNGQEASFIGKLTGYGPDCKGCGGNSACAPRQNFKNGNIYYNDSTYGKIRIVAADKSLPCGSIVRLNNVSIYDDPVIAIVMDRGGSVKGKHLDLLFETEKNMQGMHTQNNIQFDILRLGFSQ